MRYREELAWAAGFFDGEGCTSRAHKQHKEHREDYVYPIMVIAQCDREPLERFRDAVGLGRINGPRPARDPHNKPVYTYSVNGFERVQAILAMLWPWLSSPKRQQAGQILQAHVAYWNKHGRQPTGQPRPQRRSYSMTTCPYGHEYTPENTYIGTNGCRECRTCRRESQRRYREQKRRGVRFQSRKASPPV